MGILLMVTNLSKRNWFLITNVTFATEQRAAEYPWSLQPEPFPNLISAGVYTFLPAVPPDWCCTGGDQ